MLAWLTEATIPAPNELVQASRSITRRTNIDKYRSRTEVTTDHIYTAYAWLKLPVLIGDELQQLREWSMKYKTAPITRGIPEEEALENAKRVIANIIEGYYNFNIIMFNTGTAAAGSARLKSWLDEQENWHELDVATLVTTTATHKINIYKFERDGRVFYTILNNLDTPTVVFKIATALIIDQNYFNDNTEAFAEAWLTGNADTIYTKVAEYYEAYTTAKKERERNEALTELSKAMLTDKTNEFRDRIDSIQRQINSLFDEISNRNAELEQVKGEYLLYKLEDMEDKGEELRNFFASCGDKITHIHFCDNKLYLAYCTSLMYFEPDMLNRYFESNRSNCVNSAPEHIQQLLTDIFLNNKYDLLIESGVKLDIEYNRVNFVDPTQLKHCVYTDLIGLPNPHHMYYNCWGDNAPLITRALIEKDFITGILQVFAAMSGLNIADSAVMEKFVQSELVNYTDTKCLKNKTTGEIITIRQYQRRYEDAHASAETN